MGERVLGLFVKRRQPLDCICHCPPFDFKDYERIELGMDVHGAEVSLETCKKCSTVWLKYLIEQPHFRDSGRWWRAKLAPESKPVISVASAKEYIEHQADVFVGGSFFNSTGHSVKGPNHIA